AVRVGEEQVVRAVWGRGEACDPAVEPDRAAVRHNDAGPDDVRAREAELVCGDPFVRSDLWPGSRQVKPGGDRAVEHEVRVDRAPVHGQRHRLFAEAEERLAPGCVDGAAPDSSKQTSNRIVADAGVDELPGPGRFVRVPLDRPDGAVDAVRL